MSQEIASAFVRIRPNMTGFQSGVETGVREGFSNLAKIAGVAFGAVEAVHFGKDLIQGAAQLQKSIETINAQFGESAAEVKEFGEKGATALGISAAAADSTSARFGILFKNIGIGEPLAAKMTIGFEQLGGALSAIRGKDPTEVINNLTLAAAGNTRGLKQLGIVVTDTTAKVAAYKLGLISSMKDALTPAIKAEAIYAIATQNLGGYLKQAAEHSKDAANVQRVLSAEWSNAKDELGAGLLPAVVTVTKFFADYLPGAIDVTKLAFGDLADVVKGVADLLTPIFKPVITELGRLRDAIQFNGGFGTGIDQLKFDFGKLSDAGKGATIVIAGIAGVVAALVIAAFPVTSIVFAIVGLTVAFKEAYTHSARFRDIVGQIGKFVTGDVVPALKTLADDVSPVFDLLYKLAVKLEGGLKEVATQAGKVKDAFKGGFGAGLDQIKKSLGDLGPAGKIALGVLVGITGAIAAMVIAAFPISATVLAIIGLGIAFKEAYDHSARFRAIIDGISQFITGTFVPAVQSIIHKLGPDFAAVGQLAKTAFGDLIQIVTAVMDGIKTVIGVGIAIVQGIWSRFGDTITTIVKNDFGGAVTIIKDVLDVIRGTIEVVTGLITGDWSKVWSGLKTIIGGSLDAVKTVVVTFGNDVGALFSGIWKNVEKLALEGVKKVLDVIGAIPTSFHVLGQKIGFDNPAKAAAKSVQGMIDSLNAGKPKLKKAIDEIQSVKPSVPPVKIPAPTFEKPGPVPPDLLGPLTKNVTDQAGAATRKIKDSTATLQGSLDPKLSPQSPVPGLFGPVVAGVQDQADAAGKSVKKATAGLRSSVDPKFDKPAAPVGLLGPATTGILEQINATNKKLLDATTVLRRSTDPGFKKLTAPLPGLYGPVVQGFTEQANSASLQIKAATSKVQGVNPEFKKPDTPPGLFGPLTTGINSQVTALNHDIKTSVAGISGLHPTFKKPDAPPGLFGPLGKGVSDQAADAGRKIKSAVTGLQGPVAPTLPKPAAPVGIFGPLVQGIQTQAIVANQNVKTAVSGIRGPLPVIAKPSAPVGLFGPLSQGILDQVDATKGKIRQAAAGLTGSVAPVITKPSAPPDVFGPVTGGIVGQAAAATKKLHTAAAGLRGAIEPRFVKPTAPAGLLGPVVTGIADQANAARQGIRDASQGLQGALAPTFKAAAPPSVPLFDGVAGAVVSQATSAKAKIAAATNSLQGPAPRFKSPAAPAGLFGPITTGITSQVADANRKVREAVGHLENVHPRFTRPTAPAGLFGPITDQVTEAAKNAGAKIKVAAAGLTGTVQPQFTKPEAPADLYGPLTKGISDQTGPTNRRIKEAASSIQGPHPSLEKPLAPPSLFDPFAASISSQLAGAGVKIKSAAAALKQDAGVDLAQPLAPSGLYGPLVKGVGGQVVAAQKELGGSAAGLQGAIRPNLASPTAPAGLFGPLVQGIQSQIANVNQRIREASAGIQGPTFKTLTVPTGLFGPVVQGVQNQVIGANIDIKTAVAGLEGPTPDLTKPDAPAGLFGPLVRGVGGQVTGANKGLKDAVAGITGLDGPTLTKPSAPPGLFGPLVAGVQAQADAAREAINAASAGLTGPVGAQTKAGVKAATHAIVSSVSSDQIPSDIIAATKQGLGASYSAAIAKAAEDGTSKGIAGGVKAGAKAGTSQAIKDAQESLSQMKQALAQSIQQNTLDIQASVDQAKQNLSSIGQSLASSIGSVLQQPLTNLQNKLQKQQDELALKTLQQSTFLPGGKKLSSDPDKAVAQLQALANKAGAVTKPAIDAFILQYQQAVLAVKQDQVNATTTSTTKSIADLTNAFNTGHITAKQLRTQVLALLQKDGVSYKKAGELLGTAFATGFQSQLTGLTKQAAALNAGPKLPGSGQEPTIVQPLLVVQKGQLDIAKQSLAIQKAQAGVNAKIASATKKAADALAAQKSVKVNPTALETNPGDSGKKAKNLVGTG